MKTTTGWFIVVFASVVLVSASALPQEFICGGGDDNEAMTPPSIPAAGKLVFVHAAVVCARAHDSAVAESIIFRGGRGSHRCTILRAPAPAFGAAVAQVDRAADF